MKLKVELLGRDYIEVEFEEPPGAENPEASKSIKKVSFIGCSEFSSHIAEMRMQFGNDISKWPEPAGTDHSSLLIKEMILRLRGDWKFPYAHAELCHCRLVATLTVDEAVIAGAHTPEVVTRLTSASSACGSCRKDVQRIIDYRLGRNEK
ncbi:MAG: (2Fe-2S)-binding protein [Pseudobdellovibrionaceae bacterium]